MAPIDDTLSVFEGESSRIVWLPPITLGYIFTLSGHGLDFWLAVSAIGGARYFHDLLSKSESIEEQGEEMSADELGSLIDLVTEGFSLLKGLAILFYFAALIKSILRLNVFFSHTDPVIVALSGIYWGILIIVIINLYDVFRN